MNKLNVPALWSEQQGKAIAKQQELAKDAYSTDQSFEEMRVAYNTERAFWNEGGPVMAATSDVAVHTPHGDVMTRHYRPVESDVLPVIFYIHGGGWVLGNLDTHDRVCRILAAETGAAVVAIDYTLSPEAKYPQALEECAAVVEHVRANARNWGIDPDHVSSAGDSGGANLALATYLYLRDEKNAADCYKTLLLFYGSFGLKDSSSFRLLGGEWDGLKAEDFEWYKDLYFSNPADADAPYFNLLNNDLSSGMPACHIVGLELDPLRDDSRTLAKILEHTGQTVEYRELPGVIHGMIHHSRMVDEAMDMLEKAAAFYTTNKN